MAIMMNSIDVAGVNGSLAKADEELYAEAKKVRGFVEDLHLKHRQLSAELGTCGDFQAKDQAEVKRLKGVYISICLSCFYRCQPQLSSTCL